MNRNTDASREPAAPSGPAASDTPTVLDWARTEGAADRVIADMEQCLRRKRRQRRRAALAVAAVLVAGGLVWAPRERPAEPGTAALVARDAVVLRPVQRALPDGSIVELNAGADIDVDFSGPLRRVVLRHGEGHFDVAKDPLRPFVVSAGEIEVRAVGTAFAVGRAAHDVEVLVTEGRVAVERPRAPEAAGADEATLGKLDAGGRMVVSRPADRPAGELRSEISTVSAQVLGERLAWRVPRLELAATPLAQTVALFNEEAARRGGDRLVLGDPALGRLLLSGLLRADDTESLLRLLEGEFQVRAERQGDVLVLRPGRAK